MDVVPPRLDGEDISALPIQPSFREAGIRLHHSNPYTLQLTYKMGFVDFHSFINIFSPINLMSKGSYNKIFKKELDYLGNNFLGEAKNVSVFVGTYTFLVDFMIFDDIIEFVECGLEEVIVGTQVIIIFVKSRSFVIIGCFSYLLLTLILCYKFTRLKYSGPWALSPYDLEKGRRGSVALAPSLYIVCLGLCITWLVI
jgi:hypothetical protein